MLFYYSQSLIFLLSKNGLDILQLLQNRVSIQKSTRYFATCTKNRPDILLSKNRPDILQLVQKTTRYFAIKKSTRYFATCTKNRPDILLSKNRPDIFKVVQKSTRYFAAKKSSRFLVENRTIKSMHNFETNGAPYYTRSLSIRMLS